jgi:hypothetical protein
MSQEDFGVDHRIRRAKIYLDVDAAVAAAGLAYGKASS